jgi:hypothetical protein
MNERDDLSDEGKPSGFLGFVEHFAVVVLSLTTVLTAWSAFQSTKWGGVQANSYAAASGARTESVRASTTAGQQTVVDASTFIAWSQAVSAGNTALADFYFERFRDEFKPAVSAWIATMPLTNPNAPSTPFEMDEYVLAAAEEGRMQEQRADAFAETARQANQRSDNYVAVTVLFAGVLFFIGVSTRLRELRARLALTALGALGMIVGIIILVASPVEVW